MAIPVYVVPGLFGSGLWTQGKGRYGPPGTLIWSSKTRLTAYLLDPLRLDSDGLSPWPGVGTNLFPRGLYGAEDWKAMDNALDNGNHVHVDFPYDWRLSFRVAAGLLAAALEQAATQGQWAVVCHSAGAMVMLLTWIQLSDQAKAACLRVVWVDPSIAGSYDAVRGLAGGFYGMYGWGQLSAFLSAVVYSIDNAPFIAPDQRTRLNAALASWPSLYQLLPQYKAQWQGLDPQGASVFDITRYVPAQQFLYQKWMDEATAVQADIRIALSGTLPPSVRVIGDPAPTAQRLAKLAGDLTAADDYVYSNDGDGVVPSTRNVVPGAATLVIDPDHQSIPGSPDLTRRINDIIDRGLATDQMVPAPPIIVGPKALGPPANAPSVTIPGPFPASDSRPDP